MLTWINWGEEKGIISMQIDKCSNCMTSLIFDEIAVGISQTGKSKDIGAEIKSYHQKMRRNK